MKKFMFGLVALGMSLLVPAYVSQAQNRKVTLCHVTAGDGTGHVIEVSVNAVPAHIGHGDSYTHLPKGSDCSVKSESQH